MTDSDYIIDNNFVKADTTTIPTSNPAICEVTPVQAFMSTNLNNKIKTYKDVADRILHHLGFPAVSIVDVHRDQVYDAIAEACERYTRYAGYTKEYMVIDSRLYIPNVGIKIDDLYTIASVEAVAKQRGNQAFLDRGPDQAYKIPDDVYVTRVQINPMAYYMSEKDAEMLLKNSAPEYKPNIFFRRELSRKYPKGIPQFTVIDKKMRDYFVTLGISAENFDKSKDKRLSYAGEEIDVYHDDPLGVQTEIGYIGRTRDPISQRVTYDYDLMDYRKVIDVVDYMEGSSTSMTSLFSFEAALATQTYFTYQFSLRGFDMVSWYSMHEWRKTREKMLATQRDWSFDERTQYLRFSPQPHDKIAFMGVIECYVERPLKDIIVSPWVQDYARAIVKEEIGMARSKWGDGVTLPGGGQLAGNALAQQGVQEQKELLEKLEKNNAYGEAPPCRFFIG